MAPSLPVFLLFFSSLLPFSNGSKEYKICSSPSSCGHIKDIKYPFWGENIRPQYCGLPPFKLTCYRDDYPRPWMGETYRVRSINTSNHTIVVDRDSCGALEGQGQQFGHDHGESSQYKLGAGVVNITLFIGCPNGTNATGAHRVSIRCLNLDVNVPVYYAEKGAQGVGQCPGSVTMPVSKKAFDEFVNSGYDGVTLENGLQEPFEVDYLVNLTDCLACRNSGGACGSSVYAEPGSNNLVCYHRGKTRYMGLVLGLASSTGGICTLILVAYCLIKRTTVEFSFLWRGKAKADHRHIEAYLKMHGSLYPKRYTYANIRKMTDSFKEKLGEGGYAVVYKGELSNGRPVAVKLLKQSKGNNGEEFINEVASMGRTNHVNIITLLGFCFDRKNRALVYEFMPNGSLDEFAPHGNNSHHQSLPWKTIFDIAIGTARGLEYLHRGCNTRILHFDIKPHNILLDEEFHPKISDFGLARLSPQKESTISMLEARGTIGYIAPEVFCRNFGGVSHKSDVYSYGMMVVDLVCGRTNNNTRIEGSSELYFSDWIYQRVELGNEIEVDGVMNDEERDLQRKMLMVSLWCIQTYPSNRPSISKAVEMLEGSVELIQMPPKPFLCSPPRLTFDCSTSTG